MCARGLGVPLRGHRARSRFRHMEPSRHRIGRDPEMARRCGGLAGTASARHVRSARSARSLRSLGSLGSLPRLARLARFARSLRSLGSLASLGSARSLRSLGSLASLPRLALGSLASLNRLARFASLALPTRLARCATNDRSESPLWVGAGGTGAPRGGGLGAPACACAYARKRACAARRVLALPGVRVYGAAPLRSVVGIQRIVHVHLGAPDACGLGLGASVTVDCVHVKSTLMNSQKLTDFSTGCRPGAAAPPAPPPGPRRGRTSRTPVECSGDTPPWFGPGLRSLVRGCRPMGRVGSGRHGAQAQAVRLCSGRAQEGQHGLDLDHQRRAGSELARGDWWTRTRTRNHQTNAPACGEHARCGLWLVDRGEHQRKGVVGQARVVDVVRAHLFDRRPRLCRNGACAGGRSDATRGGTRSPTCTLALAHVALGSATFVHSGLGARGERPCARGRALTRAARPRYF